MTIEEQNLRVSQQFEAYTKRPLAKSADGVPLLLLNSDKNAATIVAEMARLYPDQALTLQRCLDLIQGEFGKQLEWAADPSYRKPEAPPAPTPTPTPAKDTRTREQKLRDAGVFVRTDKATAEDVKAQENRHAESREKLKALFTDDPKRIAFDDELRSANQIQVTTSPGIISRVKSYDAREEARKQIRLKYPKYAHLAIQPDSEQLNHRPGVF